ncbi:tail fiber protein, partial [Ruthenibacterium lactatiformans]|nr:tail fiber protein [Ruthenibacterium lactatiformans]
MPVGCVIPFAGAAAPTGWLLCQGQAISRTTYAQLFSVIGTTYGSGDGKTTFNLPDMRGRVAVGSDAN